MTLAEIERAVATLPFDQKLALYRRLAEQLQEESTEPVARHGVLDIAPVHLGPVLRPMGDDDLLDEMLNGRT
jgi:hypothetical protein